VPLVPEVVTGCVAVCIVADPVVCPAVAVVAVDELDPQPTSTAIPPAAARAATHRIAFTIALLCYAQP